jgi:hypothetical protein
MKELSIYIYETHFFHSTIHVASYTYLITNLHTPLASQLGQFLLLFLHETVGTLLILLVRISNNICLFPFVQNHYRYPHNVLPLVALANAKRSADHTQIPKIFFRHTYNEVCKYESNMPGLFSI